jgi:hypothetical protein
MLSLIRSYGPSNVSFLPGWHFLSERQLFRERTHGLTHQNALTNCVDSSVCNVNPARRRWPIVFSMLP